MILACRDMNKANKAAAMIRQAQVCLKILLLGNNNLKLSFKSSLFSILHSIIDITTTTLYYLNDIFISHLLLSNLENWEHQREIMR